MHPSRLPAALAAALTLLLLCGPAGAEPKGQQQVRDSIRAASVTVCKPGKESGHGSGTLLLGKDGRLYCLSAWHVVKSGLEWEACRVRTTLAGAEGWFRAPAKVVHVSSEEDLALLVLPDGFGDGPLPRVRFHDSQPPLDTPLYLCGSPHGIYHHTLDRGHLAAYARRVGEWKQPLDQASMPAMRGVSGGGVYDRQGRLVGVAVGSNLGGVLVFSPARRVRAWLDRCGVQLEQGGEGAP